MYIILAFETRVVVVVVVYTYIRVKSETLSFLEAITARSVTQGKVINDKFVNVDGLMTAIKSVNYICISYIYSRGAPFM